MHGQSAGGLHTISLLLGTMVPRPRNEVMSEWVSTCLVDGVVLGVSISWVSNLVCGHKSTDIYFM